MEIKCIQFGKEEIKPFVEDMIIYVEILKELEKNNLEISAYSKVAGYKVDI